MAEPIEPVELRTGELLLRPWRADDAPEVARICADPDIARWIPAMPVPYTVADAEQWFATQPSSWASASNATWAVTDAATGAILGSVGMHHLDHDYPEVGYWTAPDARGRGVTVAAVRATCRWALDRGAPKVLWLAAIGNEASWRVAHRVGFALEGRRLAEVAGRDGRPRDMWAASLLPAALAADPPGFPFDPLPDLTAGDVSLRRWAASDAARWVALNEAADVTGWAGPGSTVRGVAEMADAIEGTYVEDWILGRAARFAVCLDGEPVGGVSLRSGPFSPGGAGEVGWWLGPGVRGRGVGTRAVRLLAAWGFEQLGLRRVSAGIHVDNAPSRALAARVGFLAEGTRRLGAPAFGPGWGDAVAHGLLPGDLR